MTHWFVESVDAFKHKAQVLEQHCQAEGRDPSTIVRWIGPPLILVRDAEEARDMAARIPAERLARLRRRCPSRRLRSCVSTWTPAPMVSPSAIPTCQRRNCWRRRRGEADARRRVAYGPARWPGGRVPGACAPVRGPLRPGAARAPGRRRSPSGPRHGRRGRRRPCRQGMTGRRRPAASRRGSAR